MLLAGFELRKYNLNHYFRNFVESLSSVIVFLTSIKVILQIVQREWQYNNLRYLLTPNCKWEVFRELLFYMSSLIPRLFRGHSLVTHPHQNKNVSEFCSHDTCMSPAEPPKLSGAVYFFFDKWYQVQRDAEHLLCGDSLGNGASNVDR